MAAELDEGEVFAAYPPPQIDGVSRDWFSPTATFFKKKPLIAKQTFNNCDLKRLHDGVFADNISWFIDYHTQRKDKKTQLTKWTEEVYDSPNNVIGNDSVQSMNGGADAALVTAGVRVLNCITTVKELTSYDTPFVEAQQYVMIRPSNTMYVQISSHTPKVSFGTKFRVETLLHFVYDPSSNSTTATVYFNVMFIDAGAMTPKSMIKSEAEKQTALSYTLFCQLISDTLEQKPSERRRRKSRAPVQMAELPPPMPEVSNPSMIEKVMELVGNMGATHIVAVLFLLAFVVGVMSVSSSLTTVSVQLRDQQISFGDALLGHQRPKGGGRAAQQEAALQQASQARAAQKERDEGGDGSEDELLELLGVRPKPKKRKPKLVEEDATGGGSGKAETGSSDGTGDKGRQAEGKGNVGTRTGGERSSGDTRRREEEHLRQLQVISSALRSLDQTITAVNHHLYVITCLVVLGMGVALFVAARQILAG